MDYKMEMIALLLCVIPAFVTTITITSNGNTPSIKMKRGMTIDTQKESVSKQPDVKSLPVKMIKVEHKINDNSSKLSINERYRRLIPYMTFYYANDLAVPTTDNVKDVEVEKAEIIETGEIRDDMQREPKKISYLNQNIPRYQGNRLTQHNIASANPTKVFYQSVPLYQTQNKFSANYNPLLSEYNVIVNNNYEPIRVIHKPVLPKYQNVAFVATTRKPFLTYYNDGIPNIRYYLSEKDQSPKYRLVPYKQTPPIKITENENIYERPKNLVPVPVLTTNEHIYIKPRPARPQYVHEEVNIPQSVFRTPSVIVSENYYENKRPAIAPQSIIRNGFKPIYNTLQHSKEETRYTTSMPDRIISYTPQPKHRVPSRPLITIDDLKQNYYQYVVEETTTTPPRPIPSNSIPLATLLSSLQLKKSIPKPVTKENTSSSIRTLLQALNALKAVPLNEVEVPHLSTPTPFVVQKVVEVATEPVTSIEPVTELPQSVNDDDLHEEPYLAHVNSPSQFLDDTPSNGGTVQRFPPPVTSDDEGGTPGQPGVDYPILTVIPPTSFDCKTQRYKGFFADPETRCQVWHYCDLNGGQASFLCPNGTIFSQAGLTCDWWFNVRCASTTQLYVLNESLYKYILPHKPKFPEDYSGPLVDKYLTLKFKEMEEQFKKNKNKQSASEKIDSDEKESEQSDDDSSESNSNNKMTDDETKQDSGNVGNEPSVIVESPGTSGNVERLHE